MIVDIQREKVKKRIREFRLLFLLYVALIALAIFQAVSAVRLGVFDGGQVWLTLWMFACYISVLVLSWWRLQRDIRTMRTDHHITLNPEDITFHNGHQQIAIPWGDIVKIRKGWHSKSPITVKLDPDSQYDRRVYRLQPVYELEQKRLYGEIEAAWQAGRDKGKV